MDRASKIALWRDELQQVKARFRGPGVATREELASQSGLAFLQGIGEGRTGYPPIGDTLNFFALLAEPGRVIFQGEPTHAFYNPIGSVHGGWACTLMDSCLACAVHTHVPKGRGYTTLEIKVNMMRTITVDVGPLRAEGKVVNVGGQIGVAEGRLYDVDDRVYAYASTTCLLFDLPSASRADAGPSARGGD
jgi:uncharacterized protein (TIGR00369 family)